MFTPVRHPIGRILAIPTKDFRLQILHPQAQLVGTGARANAGHSSNPAGNWCVAPAATNIGNLAGLPKISNLLNGGVVSEQPQGQSSDARSHTTKGTCKEHLGIKERSSQLMSSLSDTQVSLLMGQTEGSRGSAGQYLQHVSGESIDLSKASVNQNPSPVLSTRVKPAKASSEQDLFRSLGHGKSQ